MNNEDNLIIINNQNNIQNNQNNLTNFSAEEILNISRDLIPSLIMVL